MTDIGGRHESHRDGSDQGMQIVSVDPGGQILEAYVGQASIRGQYDAATGAISVNEARQPGDTLCVTFYTGYVMLSIQGTVTGLGGTYQEQELIIGKATARPAPAGTAVGGTATAAGRQRSSSPSSSAAGAPDGSTNPSEAAPISYPGGREPLFSLTGGFS